MDELETLFPGLRGSGYVVTSPEDVRYNCVAWAAGDEERWWWPDEDSHWPEGIPREETIAAFVAAYRELGFAPCDDPLVEEGSEKIAIYADPDGIPTHVSRQLASGFWSSKLGQLQDIQHQLEDLAGFQYGHCAHFLRWERSITK
ncbi:MAG: hypothetical protein ACLQGP_30730 [Isosphaeraceae bacterium]